MRQVLTLEAVVRFHLRLPYGEVSERSMVSVLKTDGLQGSGGSNPSLFAIRKILCLFLLWEETGDFYEVRQETSPWILGFEYLIIPTKIPLSSPKT